MGSFNLTRLFDSQLDFDRQLMSQDVVRGKYTHHKIVVATIVEICELANEFASFKYWKKNHEVDRKKLLEEFADCIHFFGSLANQSGSKKILQARIISNDLSEQLFELIGAVHKLVGNFEPASVERAISVFLGLGELLNIDMAMIESSYYKKQENNLKRINGTY